MATLNAHPTVKAKKERTGFGRWSLIYTRQCVETGKEFTIRKNWSGPAPRGGIYCPHCLKVIAIA